MSPTALPHFCLENLHRVTLVGLTVVLTLMMMVMRMAMIPTTETTDSPM